MTRHIPLAGIENFRDFGNYPTLSGRRVKAGLLYRSAHHHHASDDDLAIVAEIGPAHIIDLRRKDERDREPSRRWDGFEADVIENDLGHAPGDPWFEKMRSSPLTPQWFHDDAAAFYRQTPFEERHIDLFSRYFRALAFTGGPIVVHCAAGKDRTGMICALTHHLLGVSDADMMADYLLTNNEGRIEARAAHLTDLVRREAGVELPPDGARVAVSVHEDYLRTALGEMERQCGSIDAYLSDVLGVDAGRRETLEARLLD